MAADSVGVVYKLKPSGLPKAVDTVPLQVRRGLQKQSRTLLPVHPVPLTRLSLSLPVPPRVGLVQRKEKRPPYVRAGLNGSMGAAEWLCADGASYRLRVHATPRQPSRARDILSKSRGGHSSVAVGGCDYTLELHCPHRS